ncbi:alpha/beta hydrolase [Neptuniibacter sp. CAU 1671]|uniref:alpha/beta fold hydrolase n=1 Tax=Neptuniibacter sp. CAU 1671 TaxID=3032593 RepID=UPI0023DAF727|nr:alpha/beta hydrolase [Neptuniibacter sp. CAU 1671]MDF2181855.1 alpha/beta hydrolase [Neptuniibacter sp. CAU 1671]
MHTAEVRCLHENGFHRMVYRQWGSNQNDRVLLCVHGLARNSRDFDELAQAMSRDYRVICPDVVGRGDSDWLPQPQMYQIGQYMQDMTALIARLGVDAVDWVGTSMGGLIGMCLAALPNSPIKTLVLNDIGPFVPSSALQRISDYLGEHRFATLAEAEQFMRGRYPALRNLTDTQWQHLVRCGVREVEGSYYLHYDPAIATATRQNAGADVDLWALWETLQLPQLLIWGEASDVLQEPTVRRMQANPQLSLLSLPEIEHAPSLMEAEQIYHIQHWLRQHSALTGNPAAN